MKNVEGNCNWIKRGTERHGETKRISLQPFIVDAPKSRLYDVIAL
jgi:hypothetical protein